MKFEYALFMPDTQTTPHVCITVFNKQQIYRYFESLLVQQNAFRPSLSRNYDLVYVITR